MYSCVNRSGVLRKAENLNKIDTIVYTDSVRLFASIKDQDNYNFIIEGNGIKAETRSLKIFPIGLPQVQWYNKKWIYMRGSCGSSCFFAYLLPISKTDTMRTYDFPLFVDKGRQIVMYCEDEMIAIENFSSGRKTYFRDTLLQRGPYCGYSVEDIRLQENTLLFKIVDDDKIANRKVDISSL